MTKKKVRKQSNGKLPYRLLNLISNVFTHDRETLFTLIRFFGEIAEDDDERIIFIQFFKAIEDWKIGEGEEEDEFIESFVNELCFEDDVVASYVMLTYNSIPKLDISSNGYYEHIDFKQLIRESKFQAVL
ncbi:MAG TPA: hypothetical protein VF868_15285, partial [Bacteroidia bacterium]